MLVSIKSIVLASGKVFLKKLILIGETSFSIFWDKLLVSEGLSTD